MTRTALLLDLLTVLFVGAALALQHWFGDRVPGLLLGVLYALGIAALAGSLLHVRFSTTCDMSTPEQRRRYLRESMPAAVGYAVAMFGSILLLKQVEAPALRALVALLPVPFIALLLRAMVRHIRNTDELQRRIEVEAIGLSAALVSLVYFAAGLLQAAKVIDVRSATAMLWVFPALVLTYAVAKVAVARRYG